ncbi:MAG: ATP-binding cassette domain-containing protein [Oscillospiraceae bacterium]|jgi:sodium transport system ATP-binding protein|nr:ATP-binding cassette domain-containing protein [Oscillospiraceae bacterium]
MPILSVQGLTKTFKLSKKQQTLEKTKSTTKVAVSDLSFTVNEGEIFGLLGPNGAGKTTTLRILATLIKPDKGSATLDGFDVVSHANDVRHRIGFLTSELKLEDFFTPNYLFDFFANLHNVSADRRAARKSELFERFSISEFAEVKVANLSTGMKQKVSLALAIIHDPKIIIFDEPTNGLDVITARTVTDFLIEQRSQGKTIIVSTHIFSLVERICDRAGIIIDGAMAEFGVLSDLTASKSLEDRFFDLYKERVGDEL